MFRKSLIAAAAVLVGFGGAVLAQSVSVPQVSIINTDDLVQVLPHGKPSARSVYSTPNLLNSVRGYQVKSPATGFSYTFGNSDSLIVLTHSTTIAQGTITFASAPSDGAQECIYAQNIVTTLGLAAGSNSATINNAVTTIGAAANICYIYSLSSNVWNRSK